MKWVKKNSNKQQSTHSKSQTTEKEHNRELQTSNPTESVSGKQTGRKFRFRLNVGIKLFIIIFISINLAVLTTGLITLSVANDIIEENAEQAAYETIQATSEKIDTVMLMYEQILMQLITNTDLHNWLYTANDTNRAIFDQLTAQQDIQQLLNQIMFSNSMLANVSIISLDPDNLSFSAVSTSDTGFDRESDWFVEASSKQSFTWLHTQIGGYSNSMRNNPIIGLARMMRSNFGQNYVMLIEIHHRMLHEQVDGIRLSDTSQVYVVNGHNQRLHDEDAELVLTEIELTLPEGGRGVVRGADGEDYVVVSHYSEKADWYVVGAAPVSELTEDTKLIRDVMNIIFLASAITAVLLSILVARSMGTPLRRLQALMMEGAKGNLVVRTNIRNRDEIGQVGRSFNEMMEQISGLVKQTNRSAQEVLATAQELTGAASETAHAAREISEATEQIASGASTLASQAEQGNELVVDLSKQLEQVVLANRSMSEVASDVHQVSERGTRYMSELTDKTQRTEEMTRRMVEKVDQLKESTASIRSLLDMLTKITQQTNILALNASIEASRSGTAGRGFMVIAGEIRQLADQSRESINVVAEMTEQIQGGIDETVKVLLEAYPMFQEQIAAVKDADMIFNNVRDRMTGLVEQADQVTEAIEQLEKAQTVLSDTMSNVSAVSEESSAISEEVASSSASQLHQSDTLVRLVGNLERLSDELTESLKKFKV